MGSFSPQNFIQTIGSQAFHAGKDWFLATIMFWIHWAAGWVIHTIGWPGIVGIAACTVLLLSLSARAVRFLHSVKGMGITAGIALIGGAITWWSWPAAAVAEAASVVASKPQPQAAAVLAQVEPAASIEAEKAPEAEEPPVAEAISSRPVARLDLPAVPILAVAAPSVSEPLPLPPAPHVGPIVVALPNHSAPRHSKTPSASVTHPTRSGSSGVVATPRYNHAPYTGFGSRGMGRMGGQAASHHRVTINELNLQAAHGQGPLAGMNTVGGGFNHSMHAGGMGLMGSMHAGMGHTGHMGHH